LAALVLAAALPLFPADAQARAGQACTTIETPRASTRIHVELSARVPERAYCIHAGKGQHLRAGISNARGVEPSGRVISPDGKMNGGPGGPFFSGECRESGIYRIQAGQRGRKRAGSYDLTIEIGSPR